MNRRVRQTVMVLSLVLLAVSLASAGPPNPTLSDDGGNTVGGTGALINAAFDDLENTDNTAFGFNALFSNIFARYNTASGASALISANAPRASLTGPKNSRLPRWRISRWVHRSSTSASRCELMTTAAPAAAPRSASTATALSSDPP